ncbi:MAG: hypothetical protein IKY39_03560, partial [Clostridia bacterium]|nr:hypothetical protein [Clostridia bacterium]
QRRKVLEGENLYSDIIYMVEQEAKRILHNYFDSDYMIKNAQLEDFDTLNKSLANTFPPINLLKSSEMATMKFATLEEEIISRLTELTNKMFSDVQELEKELEAKKEIDDAQKIAEYYKDVIISRMAKIRESADAIEVMTERTYWPYPSYADLLFGVR